MHAVYILQTVKLSFTDCLISLILQQYRIGFTEEFRQTRELVIKKAITWGSIPINSNTDSIAIGV